MSVNVKINNVTYNGIGTIKLPLADGSGIATFVYDDSAPSVDPLYTMVQGGPYAIPSDASLGTYTVDGNTVSINVKTTNGMIGLLNRYVPGVDAQNVSPLPEWISIPANSTVTVKIKNGINTDGRTVSLIFNKTGDYNTRVVILSGQDVSSPYEGSVTVENAMSVNALQFWTPGLSGDATGSIQFDLEIYVNGVRYI